MRLDSRECIDEKRLEFQSVKLRLLDAFMLHQYFERAAHAGWFQ